MVALCMSPCFLNASSPKWEFRGAWLQTVYQTQYAQNTTARNKAYLLDILDRLQAMGINAVIFQVRPSADAFYASGVEPWSRYLSGTAGKAPVPAWDPLQFMVEQCHKRGMELHAWLNPYRVTTSSREKLPQGHLYHSHPEMFVTYGGKIYFDPGLPESRKHIEKVVHDIVERYDVDAIHLDDYFYPYPIPKKKFPDAKSFRRYGKGMARDDWRRHNVDLLIEGLHKVIKDTKPWVRLGISPFGIWRNASSDSNGSATSGLENYGDLYADVLKWTREGWVDYMLPQVYWELDHRRASYRVLVDWWAEHGNGRHVYIGQDVERTMGFQGKKRVRPELHEKMSLARSRQGIQGSCWWPGYPLADNRGGIADSLSTNYYDTPALVPSYTWIENHKPDAIKKLHYDKGLLSWKEAKKHGKSSDVVRYVVYHFDDEESVDINNAEGIISIVNEPRIELGFGIPGVYLVTALDRVNNESSFGDWRMIVHADGTYEIRH